MSSKEHEGCFHCLSQMNPGRENFTSLLFRCSLGIDYTSLNISSTCAREACLRSGRFLLQWHSPKNYICCLSPWVTGHHLEFPRIGGVLPPLIAALRIDLFQVWVSGILNSNLPPPPPKKGILISVIGKKKPGNVAQVCATLFYIANEEGRGICTE